jgi:PilZ domain
VKRLGDLTVEDLAANLVWRYEGGNGSDALVSPADRKALSQMDDEIFLAATEFELFDSSRYAGYCFPADDSGIDYLQPVIVIASRHLSFWFDTPVKPETLAAQWSALDKKADAIFPVGFRCLVPVDGRTVRGQIDGVASSEALTSGGPAPQIVEDAEFGAATERVPTARPVQARRDTGAIEKRTALRRKAEMSVEFVQDGFHGTGITRDLSRRGMFVHTTRIPGAGPALRLSVNLPDGRKIVLTGRVIRTAADSSSAAPSGFGLRLTGTAREYDDLFSALRDKPR